MLLRELSAKRMHTDSEGAFSSFSDCKEDNGRYVLSDLQASVIVDLQ